MFRRARYQQGTIDRVKRKRGPDCWIFRWRETDAKGNRVRRKSLLGTVKEYPTESSALRAAEALRLVINQEQPPKAQQPVSLAALIEHFKQTELGPMPEGAGSEEGRAYSTRTVYTEFLDRWVLPKWGEYRLREVRTVEVERWLRV